jgi:hypothetical protein
MNGSARGTALVALVLAAPVLCASMIAVARGSVRAVTIWVGATNPVLVQHLSFWIPLTAVSAARPCSRRVSGYVIVGVVLTMGVIESVGIAVDQGFGHAADPTSSVATATVVPAFAVLAAIGLVPLFFYYRNPGQRGAS